MNVGRINKIIFSQHKILTNVSSPLCARDDWLTRFPSVKWRCIIPAGRLPASRRHPLYFPLLKLNGLYRWRLEDLLRNKQNFIQRSNNNLVTDAWQYSCNYYNVYSLREHSKWREEHRVTCPRPKQTTFLCAHTKPRVEYPQSVSSGSIFAWIRKGCVGEREICAYDNNCKSIVYIIS